MIKALWLFLAMLAGSLSGLALTYAAIADPPNFGVVKAGPWVVRPNIGATGGDPYSKALLAARGEIPMAAAEGIALTATVDSTGRPLRLNCTYSIAGVVPAANFWTMTVHLPGGARLPDAQRVAYTSSEALMGEQGELLITLSRRPYPGNWIPLAGTGAFELYLRLYETQISSSAAALAPGGVPVIRREACE